MLLPNVRMVILYGSNLDDNRTEAGVKTTLQKKPFILTPNTNVTVLQTEVFAVGKKRKKKCCHELQQPGPATKLLGRWQ